MVEPTPGQAACVLGGAGSQAWAARHGTGRRHFERAARTLYGVEATLGIEVDAVELQAARGEADIGDAARQRLGDLRRRGAGLACVFAGLPAYPPAESVCVSMGVSETCQATSARSAPSLATRKLGLIAHPSMDQWLFHLETKPTAPPGCARSAAGVQLAAAGAAQVVVRLAAAGGGGTGGGCWTPRTQDTGCFGCRPRVQASGPGFGARERRCWSRTRAALGGAALGLVGPSA